jgi:hypothetical protein
VELSEVREDFRKEKAEREHIRVRNTLLQDMSKIIVDKCLKPDKPATKPSNVPDTDDVHVEDIVQNKNRGYRRVSPVDIPAKENESNRNEDRIRTVVDLKILIHARGYNIVTSITTLADVSLKRDLGNSASLPTK